MLCKYEPGRACCDRSSRQKLGQGLPGHTIIAIFLHSSLFYKSNPRARKMGFRLQKLLPRILMLCRSARGRTTAFNGASAWDFSSGHVPRATHPHDSCAPAIERQLEALNMPFHCPEVSVVCPASRPYPGALGFRPALVPNRACMTARSLRQRPGTLSSVPLVRRVPMPTAVGVRAAIETSERGPARVWSPPAAGREIMCACACVRPVLQNA